MKTLAAMIVAVALSWAGTGSAVVPGPVGSLTVYDARGAEVGRVIGLEQASSPNGWEALVAYRDRTGRIAIVRVHADGYRLSGEAPNQVLYYTTTDCSGQAHLLRRNSAVPLFFEAMVFNEAAVYVPVPGTDVSVRPRSSRSRLGCLPITIPGTFEKAQRVRLFLPPFVVRETLAPAPADAGE